MLLLALLLVTFIIIVAIILEYRCYKDNVVTNVRDFNLMSASVSKIYLVKRNLFLGYFPISTSLLSHWALVLQTGEKYVLLASMSRHVVELEAVTRVGNYFINSSEKHPFTITVTYDVDNLKVSDVYNYMRERNVMNDYSLIGYNCHSGVRDVLEKFTPSHISDRRGVGLLANVFYELANYERCKL